MHRTRIKICGITREQDLDHAVAAGADAVGFNFYPRSPRFVTPARAAELARRLPPFVMPVSLFVNPEAGLLREALAALPTALLQFHGDEPAQACRAPGRPYLRAARITPDFDLAGCAAEYADAAALLLDAHVESYGGGGKPFDWSLLPTSVALPVVLSGGLNPANVTAGIVQVRPWAVDVASGVEEAKGIKSAALMRAFCAAVRQADERLAVGA